MVKACVAPSFLIVLTLLVGCYESRLHDGTAAPDGSVTPPLPPLPLPDGSTSPPPAPPPTPTPTPTPPPSDDPISEYIGTWNETVGVICRCFDTPGGDCTTMLTLNDEFEDCARQAWERFDEDEVAEGLACATAANRQMKNCLEMTRCDEAGFERCSGNFERSVMGCSRIGSLALLFDEFTVCREETAGPERPTG